MDMKSTELKKYLYIFRKFLSNMWIIFESFQISIRINMITTTSIDKQGQMQGNFG